MQAVSVIMATNRIDDYLSLAVKSVFASRDVAVELVLVLDGVQLTSPGPEWQRDPRLHVVPQATSNGLPAALNAGLAAATHEVIARLDADDLMEPDRLAIQLSVLDSVEQPILVGSVTQLIDEHGRTLTRPQQPCGSDVRRTLLLHNVVPHSTYLMRKSDALRVGGYNAEFRQMEDYDFLLRLAELGPVRVLCEPLVRYRVHSAQMSAQTAWRANYITAVLRGRRRLGRALGVSPVEVALKNLVWRAAQLARSLRLIRARHLAGVSHP